MYVKEYVDEYVIIRGMLSMLRGMLMSMLRGMLSILRGMLMSMLN